MSRAVSWACFGVWLFVLNAVAAADLRPPLAQAAKHGDEEAVRTLLKQAKTNVNATEPDGTTALHWASYNDELAIADLLIRAGAKVNAPNDLGVTPLWTACENGSEAMVRLLLAAGANANAKLLAGETALMMAARTGNRAVAEQLLAKGADVNAHATRGQTALMWAVAQRHPDVVQLLLAHHADVHARSDAWSQVMAVSPHGYLGYNRAIPHGDDTPLLFAARVGDVESAKLLIAAGGDVNDADAWGVSATVLAAHSGFTDFVQFLLGQGADPNAAQAGFTALHEAIMRRDETMVRALLDHGADANVPLRAWTPTRRSSKDYNFEPELVGATPFWFAARFTEPNVMRLLLKQGADPAFVHHADKVVEGRGGVPFQHQTSATTALMAATGIGVGTAWVEIDRAQREALALETVKLLVELGIDVNATSSDGRTALDGARTLNYQNVAQFLLEKGAKSGVSGRAVKPPGI